MDTNTNTNILPSLIASVSDTTPVELLKVKPLTRVKVIKVHIYNADTADHVVTIGYSPILPDGSIDTSSFTPILPGIKVLSGQTVIVDTIPGMATSTKTDLYAVTAVIEAPVTTTNVQVQVGYEEA